MSGYLKKPGGFPRISTFVFESGKFENPTQGRPGAVGCENSVNAVWQVNVEKSVSTMSLFSGAWTIFDWHFPLERTNLEIETGPKEGQMTSTART